MGVIVDAFEAEGRAIDTWGADAQRFMVCEEAGELATAVAQHKRGRITDEELLAEAADGIIVSCAAATLAGKGPAQLIAAVQAKLDRLNRRLDGEHGHFGPSWPEAVEL